MDTHDEVNEGVPENDAAVGFLLGEFETVFVFWCGWVRGES